MNASMWALGLAIALLAAVNAVCWGYAIREVGDPQMTLNLLFRLSSTDGSYLLVLALAFIVSILSYAMLREMDVIAVRFFLSLGIVAMVLADVLVLKETLTPTACAGMLLIMIGVLLIGRW